MSSHLLTRGIALWKSGRNEEARRIFETVVKLDNRNESAWVWYVYSLKTEPEKITALREFLTLFPQHATAQKALAGLEAKQADSGPPEEARDEKAEDIPPARLTPLQEARPEHRTPSSFLPWILVVLGLCFFLASSAAYVKDRNSLQTRLESLAASNQLISQNLANLNAAYQSLQAENGELSDRYKSLTGQYDSLNGEFTLLQGKYDTLNNDYTVLSGKYDTLSTEYTGLTNVYNELLASYHNTVDSYSAFREIAIAPPYIYTRQRQVHLVFQKRDGSLIHWTIPSEWLEYHLRLGDEQRQDLAYKLSLHNADTGETYRVVDDRDFIDATPFTSLMEDLYRQSPNETAFIAEVWNIVAQLTAYTDEIDETPRFPMETLLSGGGDCEDHAILFASMILAAPTNWEVKFVYMDGDHPTQPQTVNHVIVQVITPAGSHIVEATSQDLINPYDEGVTGWTYSIPRTND